MLTVTEVGFAYGRKSILTGVNLSIHPGEWVGLHGASGSGKTTLGRIIVGHLRPSTGKVTVEGLPPRSTSPRAVQMISQNPLAAVNPRWRIVNILRERVVVTQVEAVLDSLGVRSEWLARWPHEVSGGELQRVIIARALLSNPRYLVADEVSAALDPVSQAEVLRALRRYCEEKHIGVLLISHKTTLLDRLCHRTVSLCLHDQGGSLTDEIELQPSPFRSLSTSKRG